MMTDEKQKMTDTETITPTAPKSGSNRRRNILLAIILAAGAFTMYVSIFLRLSVSPLE